MMNNKMHSSAYVIREKGILLMMIGLHFTAHKNDGRCANFTYLQPRDWSM